ncbi:MAG: hypothetical protein ACLRR3_03910 [Eubacterium sp.]
MLICKSIIDGIDEERVEKHGKVHFDLEDFVTRAANLGVNKRAIERKTLSAPVPLIHLMPTESR